MEDLRTTDEWLKETEFRGIEIIDPDGWDRSGEEAFAKSWNERINRAEMRKRVCRSTIGGAF